MQLRTVFHLRRMLKIYIPCTRGCDSPDCATGLKSSIKQIDVSFLRVCPPIDDKLCHNIVKVVLQ